MALSITTIRIFHYHSETNYSETDWICLAVACPFMVRRALCATCLKRILCPDLPLKSAVANVKDANKRVFAIVTTNPRVSNAESLGFDAGAMMC